MDPKLVILVIAGVCVAGAILINVTLGAIVRLNALKRASSTPDIEARLARIEAGMEVIASEVERLGEQQRFAARLGEEGRLPEIPEMQRVR